MTDPIDNRDDTAAPFAEPFPLADSDRVIALQAKGDALAAEVMAYRSLLIESRRCWVPDSADLAARIDAKVGTQPRGAAALQYGGG